MVSLVGRWWRSWVPSVIKVVLGISLLLLTTGCVDYDMTLRFDHQTHGVLTQTLQIESNALSSRQDAYRAQWLQAFVQSAKRGAAQVKRKGDDTISVRLPFYTLTGLNQALDHLWGNPQQSWLSQVPGVPPVMATLSVTQVNRWIAVRTHLRYDVDLSELRQWVPPEAGVMGQWRWLNLTFQLQTPWGMTLSPDSLPPDQQGKTTQWHLLPGQVNHIEVDFWLPSPLGLGALGIVLLMGVGWLLTHSSAAQGASLEAKGSKL